jgi:hypothetical protein
MFLNIFHTDDGVGLNIIHADDGISHINAPP